jgi:hypothetical protein
MKIKALIAAIVLAIAGGVIYFTVGTSSPANYIPTQATLNHDAIREFHKLFSWDTQTGLSAQCAFDGQKATIGYKFTCYVYGSDSTEVAELNYTVTTVSPTEFLFNVGGQHS